ncbi:ERC protein 2 isoform X3 [Dendroctonus ponderosae]|uniref:ERC protein 2 isoform X3 n=1 Tax=Dendroctonus ponderosae TaxID=77166 RepID=UPI002035DD05|nr:ERC protein 2 isoform X3 [Dendroctonus ponderosae]
MKDTLIPYFEEKLQLSKPASLESTHFCSKACRFPSQKPPASLSFRARRCCRSDVEVIMTDIFAMPKTMLFPDELSSCLKDQSAVFAQENAVLKRDLVGLEDKYAQMQVETESLKNLLHDREKVLLPQFAASSQNVSSKIVELSKSYREKCSELEKYKTRCSKLQTQLQESKSREQPDKDPPKPAVEKSEDSTAKEKQLQKLSAMTSKMLELKNANMQLNNELKQARKLLQQEIGQDMETLQANGSWKGRAQIICDLVEKNKKLKEKLKNASADPQGARTDSHTNERISNRVSSLENENHDLKTQLQCYKSKGESLKSRCQMLESEQQALKLRVQDVKERSASDLDLIASMSSQLAEAEHAKRSAVKERELEIAKLRLEIENLKAQVENYKTLMDGFKRSKDCREATTQNCQNTEEIGQSIAKLEEQKLKLLELVKLHKKRIEDERSERQRCEQLLRMERQKSVRLESTVAKSELDCAAPSRSRYSTPLNRNSEISLQDQLELAEENIKALQTRLQLEQGERRQDFQEFATILSTTKISSIPGQHN